MSKNCDKCETCGTGYKEWFGFGCVRQFTDYLYNDVAVQAEKAKCNVFVFAHNARGYDGHFIVSDMFRRKFRNVNIIMSGHKVLKVQCGNVHFIDSLSFFQQPLATIPKSFGFQGIVEKGFFPHLFNKEENFEYLGPIPAIEYFSPQYMKPAAACACREWHSQFTSVYNFKEQLIKYCRNDVKILTTAIQEFRKLFINITDIDPITRNFTLASIGLEYFRAKVLKDDKQIGITPINGYINGRNASVKSNIWLDWQQKVLGKQILREYHIGKYYADGYIPEEKHVFEFNGCYFHGCLECARKNGVNPYIETGPGGKTIWQLHNASKQKVRLFAF